MEFVSEKMKCRINEDEVPLVDPANGRPGSWKMVESSDHKPGEPKDVLKLKLRLDEKFLCRFEDYKDYPFDMPMFKYRFELSHFELTHNDVTETLRFDFYR